MLLIGPAALGCEQPSVKSTRAAITRKQFGSNVMAYPFPVMRRLGLTSPGGRVIGIVPGHVCNRPPGSPPGSPCLGPGFISAGSGSVHTYHGARVAGNASGLV